MARHKSAEKRARQARRREERNKSWKSQMKTAVRRVRAAKDREHALTELRKTTRLLDRLVAKGIIHRSKAANNKSRLTRLVNAMK